MATYGIDLGTTYSCVAYIDDTGRPAIAKNRDGDDTTPSVVYFETPDNVIVGKVAKRSAKDEPDLVVSLIKRRMGQEVRLGFHGVEHTPESISALILTELATAAGEFTGDEVRDAVITVPAYFGVAEREATKNAGRIAGLNVLNIVPEPVAAALHYEVVAGAAERTVLVYDLGGGTFDTTVIRISANEIKVVCTDGDHHLGGADWDDRIAGHLLEAFLAEHPGSAAGDSEEFMQELTLAAEELKKELSSAQARRHNMRFEGDVSKVELSRATFEQITAELLERTLDITARTVATAAEKGVSSFDEVLLVGGSTRMPAVAASLSERFGFAPRLHDPDLAVAKGAARFALIESIKLELPETAGAPVSMTKVQQVADQLGISAEAVRELAAKRVAVTTPRAFGVRVVDSSDPSLKREIIDHVLAANTELPSARTEQFYTVHDNQTGISVEIWEQKGDVASPELAHNAEIGRGVIDRLPPLPRNSPVDITFSMNETGLLSVHAVELKTGKDLQIELQIEGLSAREVAEARAAVSRYRVGD
ncbi:Hsp70 family protein [Frankia sp. CNm7]|uniref:Hsp70 family protein n=1 Tax=Frankia nepalensis TaxID=1836974 RepID=A0A937REI5_9ACTN|nr:Hsp70 family protein [Frankia nepalensis]MBL7499536.1 Hsp70 family protein [Frankia nepalensis]MBL7513252.1 Hsp70 family protein [Frankia nepalensis]MBL7518247.1 Hsp70 family protein [Frankia nepalensis]MBL7630711.1 Hsp70 family protein [Frankia nepalensis]